MFQFGILGKAAITPQLVKAAREAGCEVAAIASRDISRARSFADQYGIPRAYGSYEALLEQEKVDCIYVDTKTPMHFEPVTAALNHGFPVLCEKAMSCTAEEAKTIFALAKEKNLFVMEAMWSKFMPAMLTARKWITDHAIGKPALCEFTFTMNPTNRRPPRPGFGNRPAYDLLVYAYELTAFLLGSNPEPQGIQVVPHPMGTDATEQVAMRCGDCPCVLRLSNVAFPQSDLVILGETGKITIPHPHMPSSVVLERADGTREEFVDPVPEKRFLYEVEEVVRCIRSGKLESEHHPHSATLACAELFDAMDAVRK